MLGIGRFPSCLTGDLCWDPSTFEGSSKDYLWMLSSDDVNDIQNALAHFMGLGLQIPYIRPENFPLRNELAKRLRNLSDEVHNGIGFGVLRGLNPKQYTAEESVIIYCGLASYVALERCTNAAGMSMNHIRSAEGEKRPFDPLGKLPTKLNPSHTSDKMAFHADRYYADVIAMFFKESSATGGEQFLASFWTVYNRLVAEHQEVVKILAEDWNWPISSIAIDIRKSRVKKLSEIDMRGPIIFEAAGRIICQLVLQPFIDDPSLLTPKQVEAIEVVQAVAEDVCIKLDHQPGDIQIINNFALLHARKAFQDSDEKARYIMRLGLRDPQNRWELPENFRGGSYGKGQAEGFRPLEEQYIPLHDFDPWFETTVTASCGHG